MRAYHLIALLALALPVSAQGPDPAASDVCPGGPETVEDPTQVSFCWDPAEAEKGPPDKPLKPVSHPGIKAPKEKKPGEPPKIPKGPASGSKATAFRPK